PQAAPREIRRGPAPRPPGLQPRAGDGGPDSAPGRRPVQRVRTGGPGRALIPSAAARTDAKRGGGSRPAAANFFAPHVAAPFLGLAHRFHLVFRQTDDFAVGELDQVALPAVGAVLRPPIPHHLTHPARETPRLVVFRIGDSHPVHDRSRRPPAWFTSRERRSRATGC